ncbi:hypothetical protein MHY87_06390 [Microvirga sp. ACRRW]|uniref:hypothetical protein n=1 Tax=Microvirga sp. ACRRW TaxID=2918205 RepID=UPI001EF61DDF|nr:hypothetical protein [Microvirga sp. ACRRW]MCG7392530.1 hypothetical protein [Microvirga sp. ACRRW]
MTKLALIVSGSAAALWGGLESDIGKGFVKGLTGYEPAHWAELAGERLSQSIKSASAPELPGPQKISYDQLQAIILLESTKSFLQKDESELRRIGVSKSEFRGAYEARNNFYYSCYNYSEIKSIGFEEEPIFPITRSDFSRLQVALPPKEEEAPAYPWQVEIVTLKVTSPNWDRSDQQRLWKAKDQFGKEKLFKIEDEHFWALARREQLDLHVIDTIKVQMAFQIHNGRQKNIRALVVIEYNDKYLAEPLDENALNAILGDLEISALSAEPSDDLFSSYSKGF